jgi:hypothetical protein
MRHFTRGGFQRSRPCVPSAVEMQAYADGLAAKRRGNGHESQQQASSSSDATDLAQMNATYAVTKIGGKTRVMSLEESPLFPGCKVPVFSTIQDFRAFHHNRKKQLDNARTIGMGQWWIEHPERRQYDGVVYDPASADWVIPAGADARRFFVLNASAAHKQDRKYFRKIVYQMENGGREALLYLLLHRDLSGFNVGAVPQTDALATQKAFTRRGIDRLIEQICHDGILPSAHTIHPNVAVTTGEEEHRGFYYAARTLVPDLRYDSSIVIANRLKEWGCEPWKSGYQRGIRFPALADLRLRFDCKHGPQDWPTSEGGELDWEAPGAA